MKRNLLLLAVLILACLPSCEKDDDGPKLTEMKFENLTEELVIGETNTFVFTCVPESIKSNPDAIWSSDDTDIAIVDAKGLVTALSIGETVIRIKDENLVASFTLKVIPVKVTAITFKTKTSEIKIGSTLQMKFGVTPLDAIDNVLVWTSSDEGIATVNDGVVEGLALGPVIISAESNGIRSEHIVTITPIVVETITIEGLTVAVTAGKTFQLVFDVLPLDATDQTLVWHSANEAVATVDQDGLVTAVAVGNSEITATSVNGIVGTVQFGVSPIAPPPPPPPAF